MPSKKDIKTRIKAVQNTQKITKAMKLISIIKSKQVKNVINAIKPYNEQLNNILNKTLNQFDTQNPDKLPKILAPSQNINSFDYLILISSDRGLCGPYNSALFKSFEAYLKNKDKQKIKLIIIGNKAFSFVKKNFADMEIIYSYLSLPVIPTQNIIQDLSSVLLNKYISGEISTLGVLYSHYISMIKSEIKHTLILPISQGIYTEKKHEVNVNCIFEPSIEDILNKVFPLYLQNKLYTILLSAKASELSHSVNAMTAANDNAKALINSLTLKYNKLRQGSITQEILEIISGAEAL